MLPQFLPTNVSARVPQGDPAVERQPSCSRSTRRSIVLVVVLVLGHDCFTTIRHPMRCHGTFHGLNQVAIPRIQDLHMMQGLQVSQTLHIARLHGSTSRSGLVAVVVRSGLDVQFHQGQVHGVRLQSHEGQRMSLKRRFHVKWTKDGQGHDVDHGILPGMPQGQMAILSARPRNGSGHSLRSNRLRNVPGKLRLVHRSFVFVRHCSIFPG